MWANSAWLCKGTNDDGQLQTTTILIQVSLQRYYFLLVFCQYNRCRKLVLWILAGRISKKSTLKGQGYFYIYICCHNVKTISFFLDPVPWLAVTTNASTYTESESSRDMIKETSSLGIIVRCISYNPIVCADEKPLKSEAKILRFTTLPTSGRAVFSWRFTGFTHLMLWQEQHRE
jgi:hypothetical protein